MRILAAAALLLVFSSAGVAAQDFAYKRNPTLKVGQTIVLKGVRAPDCRGDAPTWATIAPGLPKPKLGKLSDGGAGHTMSNRCKGRVAARGVRYTATTPGTESFTIYDDKFTVVVK
jgi:hypothetical protein